MNFNSTHAEDALSQPMLKAWEKVQKYAGKIYNMMSGKSPLRMSLRVERSNLDNPKVFGIASLQSE